MNFDDLELMGDMQVQQAVENALASFSARLSTAQGFLVVRGDSNPLGPEIMALVLHNLSQSLPIAAQTRACCLPDGARIMGEELQLLYGALNDLLARPAAWCRHKPGTLPKRS